jgi:hypothetical protein
MHRRLMMIGSAATLLPSSLLDYSIPTQDFRLNDHSVFHTLDDMYQDDVKQDDHRYNNSSSAAAAAAAAAATAVGVKGLKKQKKRSAEAAAALQAAGKSADAALQAERSKRAESMESRAAAKKEEQRILDLHAYRVKRDIAEQTAIANSKLERQDHQGFTDYSTWSQRNTSKINSKQNSIQIKRNKLADKLREYDKIYYSKFIRAKNDATRASLENERTEFKNMLTKEWDKFLDAKIPFHKKIV